MKKRLPVMLLFCLIIYGAGYAKTIGFACIYNSDAPAESVELTTTLETELFEFCFNRGFIATSIEYIAGKSERYKETKSSGGMEKFAMETSRLFFSKHTL